MNPDTHPKPPPWWSAEFFSAKDFVRHGVLFVFAFAAVHLLGLREFTSVLNGTPGMAGMDPTLAALLGVLYVACYLAAILLAPICFLTAGLLSLWQRFKPSRRTPP
jgi:hypothetical protein